MTCADFSWLSHIRASPSERGKGADYFLTVRGWRRWDAFCCAVLLTAVFCSLQHSTAAETDDAASLNALVRELTAELPWIYRAIDNAGPRQPLVPDTVVRKVVREDIAVAQRRRAAAAQLKARGTNAWPAIPMLVDALRHANPSVGVAAANTLGAIHAERSSQWTNAARGIVNDTNAARAFRWVLSGRDESTRPYDATARRFALIGLAAVGPASQTATQAIAQVLSDPEQCDLWPFGVAALAASGSDVSAAVAELCANVRNTNEWPSLSAAAALSLACVKPDAEVVKTLREALRDPRSLVRIRAAQALLRLRGAGDESMSVLIGATSHKLPSVRLAALEVIAEAGSAAKSAKPAVEKLVSDRVRTAAEATLQSISAR